MANVEIPWNTGQGLAELARVKMERYPSILGAYSGFGKAIGGGVSDYRTMRQRQIDKENALAELAKRNARPIGVAPPPTPPSTPGTTPPSETTTTPGITPVSDTTTSDQTQPGPWSSGLGPTSPADVAAKKAADAVMPPVKSADPVLNVSQVVPVPAPDKQSVGPTQPAGNQVVPTSGETKPDVQSSKQPSGTKPETPTQPNVVAPGPPPATKETDSGTPPEGTTFGKLTSAVESAPGKLWGGLSALASSRFAHNIGDIFGVPNPELEATERQLAEQQGVQEARADEEKVLSSLGQLGIHAKDTSAFLRQVAPHIFGGLPDMEFYPPGYGKTAATTIADMRLEAAKNPGGPADRAIKQLDAITMYGKKPNLQKIIDDIDALPTPQAKQDYIDKLNEAVENGWGGTHADEFSHMLAQAAQQAMPGMTKTGTDPFLRGSPSGAFPPGGDGSGGGRGGTRGATNINEVKANPLVNSPLWGKYSRQFGVEPNLARAVAWRESNFRTGVDNGVARGLMQFAYNRPDRMATSNKYGITNDNWRDPEVQIRGGMHYLADLKQQTGNWPDALELYHGKGADMFGVTGKDYAQMVLHHWRILERNGVGANDFQATGGGGEETPAAPAAPPTQEAAETPPPLPKGAHEWNNKGTGFTSDAGKFVPIGPTRKGETEYQKWDRYLSIAVRQGKMTQQDKDDSLKRAFPYGDKEQGDVGELARARDRLNQPHHLPSTHVAAGGGGKPQLPATRVPRTGAANKPAQDQGLIGSQQP